MLILFKWAKNNHGKNAIPKWNFHKIIIGKNGKVADTFSSITRPSSTRFINLIEKKLKLKLKPSKAGMMFFGNFF